MPELHHKTQYNRQAFYLYPVIEPSVMPRIKKPLLFIVLISLLSGCFPTSVGFKDASMDPDLKFFSVENFEQVSANTPMNYPIQFTEFVKDGVVRNTKLKLVSTEDEKRHLVFSGEIVRYDLLPVSVQTDNQAAQTRLTVGMKVHVENLLKPDKSLDMSISRFVDFNSEVDYNSIEGQLLENLNEQLLQDILNKLQADW